LILANLGRDAAVNRPLCLNLFLSEDACRSLVSSRETVEGVFRLAGKPTRQGDVVSRVQADNRASINALRFSASRDKKLRLAEVKQMFLQMRNHAAERASPWFLS
jgi:hypothetical protein